MLDSAATSRLRVGKLKEAKPSTMWLFYTIAAKVAPSFVPEYRKLSVQSTAKFCDIVPLSCETLIYWFINVSYKKWVKEWEAEERFRDEHGPSAVMPPRKGANGVNYTKKELSEYCKIHRFLQQRRPLSTDWDAAVIKQIQKEIKQDQISRGVVPHVKKKRKVLAEEALTIPLDGILSNVSNVQPGLFAGTVRL